MNQTQSYRQHAQPASSWGTIAIGEGRIQVRQIIVALGIALWLLPVFISTGVNGIAWFAFNLAFIFILIAITSTVRTVPLHKLAICFLLGGLLTGVNLLISIPIATAFGQSFPLRHFITVPLEELTKLAAVALVAWRGRKFSTWTLGASDVLLMGAAAGAGFGFVEDSFIHALQHSALSNLSVLIPTTELIGSRIVCGHAVWSATVSGTIGLALLFSHLKKVALPAAFIGLGVASIDHIALNYDPYAAGFPWLKTALNAVVFNGYLALAAFVVVLAAVIACDWMLTFKNLPASKEFKFPRRKDRSEPILSVWDSILDLRRLNYAYFRYKNYDAKELPPALALTVAILAKRLVNRYLAAEPVTFTTQEVPAISIATGDRLGRVSASPSSDESSAGGAVGDYKTAAGGISPFDRRPLKDLLDLPDRYKLLEEVFKGGMGIIFKARHTQTRATLAIKILHPHLADNSNYLMRFEQEAKAASQLKHPNIVTVFDFGITPNSIAYLVMEWLEGPSLEKVVSLSGPMNAQRFTRVFIPTANALAHAHRKGVIHRDIKPSNIILTVSDVTADNPKIVDFGIAKILTEDLAEKMQLTTAGDVLGSPFFMSPEQCSGSKVDHRSDIYSLGCVMYESLCGVPPHTADNPLQVFHKHLNEMPKQPRIINTALTHPELFEPMLFKCLQKDPERRYASMEELELELKKIDDCLNK